VTQLRKRVLEELEVADIFRAFGEASSIAAGGHRDHCPGCGQDLDISYNSCRNRHCPRCQAMARDQWTARRIAIWSRSAYRTRRWGRNISSTCASVHQFEGHVMKSATARAIGTVPPREVKGHELTLLSYAHYPKLPQKGLSRRVSH